ncbi:EAL domain-containing protein [Aliikangiella sp. IMCC44653]
MKKFLAVYALFILSFGVNANKNIKLEQLSLDEGLSQAEVKQLLQDKDGFLWLGTQQGLNVYDGHRVKTLSGPDHLLEIQTINTLFEDSEGNIWVGSAPNRNFIINKKSHKITEIQPPFPEGREIQESAFFTIKEDHNKTLWMGTLRALFKYDISTKQSTFVIDFEPRLSIRHSIRAILPINGDILVGTSDGLFLVDPQQSTKIEIPFTQFLSSKTPSSDSKQPQDDRRNVKGLWLNQQGQLLVATVEGLYELDPEAINQFKLDNNNPVPVKTLEPELNVWKLIEEPSFYWLATHEGLVKLNKNGGKEYTLNYANSRFQSVDNNIIDMIKDNEGNLWLGSRNDGAFKWRPIEDRFTYFQQNNQGNRSLSNNRVWATAIDNEGFIWIGTRNGLNRVDPKSQEVRQFLVNADPKATISESTFYKFELRGEKLWMLSTNGVRVFNTKTLSEEKLPTTDIASKFLSENISDFYFKSDGQLNVINRQGLHSVNLETGDIQFNENTESNGKITKRFFRMAGQVPNDSDKRYFTMVDQVVKYSESEGNFQVLHALPPSDKPRTFATDVYSDGKQTWIAYPGFGIFVIDSLTGKEIKQFTSLDGLPDNSPLDFLPDSQGNVWVTSNSGLVKINKDTFHLRVYSTDDGLATNEFNGGAATLSNNGDFILGSIKGVMKVSPSALSTTGRTNSLSNHITKISLMSREMPEVYGPLNEPQLELTHNDYGLKIQFSALSLTNPKRLKYQYWIEGSSQTKPAITSDSELFLPKLEPGESVFKVAVIDYETGNASAPESLYLKVKPHPAFSWWAYSIYIFIFLSGAGIIYWQRRKRQVALLKAHNILQTSEQRLQLALSASDSGMWDWQEHNNLVFEPRIQVQDQSNSQLIPFEQRLAAIYPEDRDNYLSLWNKFIARESELFEVSYRLESKRKGVAWYKDVARVTESHLNGNPKRVTGTFIDITRSKDDHDKATLFSEAFQSTRDVVIITDQEFRVTAANNALYRSTELQPEKFVGSALNILVNQEGNNLLDQTLLTNLEEKQHWEGEAFLKRNHQKPLPVLINANAFLNDDQKRYTVFAITDIAEQKKAQEELQKLANYDTLTGLPNRALLMDRIGHAINVAKRNKTKIALFFIDLDRFKQINDSLGHDIGDQLLTRAAEVLESSVRQNDTVARLGGDEFVVMLEAINAPEVVSKIAQTITEKMILPFNLEQHEVSISSSIGIAIFPEDANNPADLFKNADIAMYHAKNEGRNNFQFYAAEMNQFANKRLQLENEIRAGIRNNEFLVHYQPKIDLATKTIKGFELLARWQKPDGRLIAPFEFIPLAEELGLIIAITEQLIEQGLSTMRAWRQLGIRTTFALNLSAKHLHHYDLTSFVAEKLTAYQVPANCIEFELTESTLMQDMKSAVKLLNNLNQQGIAISLDDFGTGYTSFQYLKDFPIDALKIDRSFVKDIGEDDKDEAIIETIITLANKLNIGIIAEGVETESQAEYLTQRGCPLAQGYLYSKPVQESEALNLIQNGLQT